MKLSIRTIEKCHILVTCTDGSTSCYTLTHVVPMHSASGLFIYSMDALEAIFEQKGIDCTSWIP